MLWVNWCQLAVDKEGHALHSSAWWSPLEGKCPMITDWHTAGGSVSQLSQWTKLSPWLTLSTKDINTSFWHYNKWFWFLSNQIKVTKHACTSCWLPLVHTIHHTYHQLQQWTNNNTNKSYKQLIYIYIYYIYIYISHVNVTQTVPDISPLMPMHQDPLLVRNILFRLDISNSNSESMQRYLLLH